jgi:hypothetical protein
MQKLTFYAGRNWEHWYRNWMLPLPNRTRKSVLKTGFFPTQIEKRICLLKTSRKRLLSTGGDKTFFDWKKYSMRTREKPPDQTIPALIQKWTRLEIHW